MSDKVPLSEAMDMLTVGEIGFIERHFGKVWGLPYDQGGPTGIETTSAVIWALERRKPGHNFNWPDIEAMTMKQLSEYFADEPVEIDDAEPESESGKEGKPVA